MAWNRRFITAATVVASATLLLSACGSESTARVDEDLPSAMTATVPPSGSGSASPTLPDSSAGGVPGSIDFRDPQDTYSIQISPDWVDGSGTIVKEVEVWYVSPADGPFRNNVNVLTQDTQGMDLQEYLDFSAAHLGGLELVSARIVPGALGGELGVMDYKGTLPGAPVPLHALATVAVRDGVAVVATLTTTLDTFDAERVRVEPYLLTLQRTTGGSSGTGVGTA